MTWAIVIWTVVFAVWIIGGVSATGNNCAGLAGSDLTACQAGTAIGGGIAVSLLIMLWFVGFIVLALIWFMSRPRNNVVVYGPEGQQVTVSESEAKKRVEKQGWSYAPRNTGSS
jgi:hypothetical protein